MKRNEFIEERKDSFRVHLPFTDQNGKRSFYSKSFSIKKYGSRAKALEMAKKHRDEIRIRISNEQIIKEKKASFLEIYQKAESLHQCSISTKRKDDSIFFNHIAKKIDPERDFRSIRFSDIQEQLNSMVTDCSQDTIKRTLMIWKMCFRYAIADDYIIKDETYKVTLPKSEVIIKKKDQRTSYSEVIHVIDLIEQRTKDERKRMLYKNALLIMLYTGMRPSEVFALELNSIDFDKRVIKVYQRIGSTAKERHSIVRVKTDSSIREISFSSDLAEVLKELCENSIQGFLFMKKDGKLINGDEFSDMLNKTTDGTFRAYTLRHQLTTDLLQQNTDLRTIMELMGHSESTMTLYYARSNDQKKREAIENRVINDVNDA